MKEHMLGIAISLVANAFKEETDKGGHPYVLHCLRVMNVVSNESIHVRCAAVMHDLVEDTDWTLLELRELGFSEDCIRMLDLLTHDRSVPYMDYIKSIGRNSGATAIKLADLRDNSDITRLKGLTKKDLDRMEKYFLAYTYLSKR